MVLEQFHTYTYIYMYCYNHFDQECLSDCFEREREECEGNW